MSGDKNNTESPNAGPLARGMLSYGQINNSVLSRVNDNPMSQRVYNILTTVQNEHLTLTLHLDGTWSLHTRVGPPARISRARWAVHLLGQQGESRLRSTHLDIEDVQENTAETPLGAARQVVVIHKPSRQGRRLHWQALLYEEQPYMTVSVGVSLPEETRLQRFMPLIVDPPQGHVLMEGLGPQWTFFVDGWHSWSFAGLLADNQRQPRSRLARFDAPMGYDVVHAPPREVGHFLSHTVGVLTGLAAEAPSLILAWLRQLVRVGLVEVRRTPGPDPSVWAWEDGEGMPLSAGSLHWSEPLLVQIMPAGTPEPLGHAAYAIGVMNRARVGERTSTGWCTWYHHFQHIDPPLVRSNVHTLQAVRTELPVELVQIDDGYESAVGDWLTPKPTFDGQMEVLAREIHEAGFSPGLWIAPFIAQSNAAIVKAHPDWFLHDAQGHPVSAGFLWNGFTRALDVTHPDVQNHLRQVIHTMVHRWGYRYLKLDFLYAAALPGQRHDPAVTRVQAYRRGLQLIRETAGEDVFLLGCGAPIGPSVGLVDGMRIGPDIAPHWWPKLYGLSRPFRKQATYPAAINAIRNTLTRSAYHRRFWWNDPDCVLVREKESDLKPHEVQSWLSVVGLSGGMVVFSDDMVTLSPERRAWAATLLPVQPEAGIPLDLLEHTVPETVALYLSRPWGEGVTVGLFNWRDEPRTRTLQLGTLGLDWHRPHHVMDFWNRRYYRVVEGYQVFTNMPPHSGLLLGVKPVLETPHLVGTTFHISQGGEIRSWNWEAPWLTFTIELGRDARGTVLLGTAGYTLTDVPGDAAVEHVAEGVIGLHLTVRGRRELKLRFVPSQEDL